MGSQPGPRAGARSEAEHGPEAGRYGPLLGGQTGPQAGLQASAYSGPEYEESGSVGPRDDWEPAQPPGGPHTHRGLAGYPPYGQQAPRAALGQPATVIGARVLMFIGAAFGLLLALMFGLFAALPAARSGLEAGASVQGVPPQQLPLLFGTAAFVVGVYGLVSLVLASLMGKRSPAIFWTALVFQILVLFLPLSSLTYGALPALVPLLFTIAIIVLLLLPASRAYYRRA